MGHGRGSDCRACNDPAAHAAGFPRFFYGRGMVVVAHTMEEWLSLNMGQTAPAPAPVPVLGLVPLKAKYRKP